MLVIGFHRSLTSLIAQWLHRAGMSMGHRLMPPAISNPAGHFEDMPLVDLHDRLLRLQGTHWQFHDEVPFDPAIRLDLLQRYVQLREHTSDGEWGAKDPRACLFLPAWQQVLGERGRYLVVLRHWSGSIQSLYRRHAEALALAEGDVDGHAAMWRRPELAARMWLAYNRRVLALLERATEQSLVITQQAVLAGLPLIHKLNERFEFALAAATPSLIRTSLCHDLIDTHLIERLPVRIVEELEEVWQRLLSYADYRADNEEPRWHHANVIHPAAVDDLLAQARDCAAPQSALPAQPDSISLEEELLAAVNDAGLSLDEGAMSQRIEQEAGSVPKLWESLARALIARGKMAQAESVLVRAIECSEPRPFHYLLLGVCREGELDYQAAEQLYLQAIAQNDADAMFHFRLANLWLALGRYREVEEHLRQVLLRHPDNQLLAYALANCLDLQGRTTEAIDVLKECLNPAPWLARNLTALEMKVSYEQALEKYLLSARKIASSDEAQHSATSVLASIADEAARRDLAQRLVVNWRALGIRVGKPLAIA